MRPTLLSLLVVAVVCAGCSASAARTPAPAGPAGISHLSLAQGFHSFQAASPAADVESIVQVDANTYLLCDYYDVFELARGAQGYTVTRMNRPPTSVWSPAGLAYRDGLLYIADNLGHDVLVVHPDGQNLVLVRRIARQGGPDMHTPRNVYAEADGSVVVADYDGGAVLRFNGDGSFAWSVPMPGAGGVTENGGFIYVTSTGNHTVSKLDMSGKIVATGGAYGWSPGRFVFPVGLSADAANGQLVVTDAVTGRITVLDQNLRQVAVAGANGQGADALDYPYATLPVANGYVIADTYKGRLLFTDRRWTVQYQVVYGFVVPTGRGRPLVYGSDASPTAYSMIPGVDVLAALGLRTALSFTGGFDGLDYRTARTFAHLNFDDNRVPVRFITWAQQVGSSIVVGSPQAPWLEVIDTSSGLFTYVYVRYDAWWRAGSLLYSENLRIDLAQVIKPALSTFAGAKQLLAVGTSRQKAYQLAVAGGPYNWAQNVTSAEGKQFLSSAMTKADAGTYYAWAVRQPNIDVAELLVVKYLSGS
jgi:hypothetical protein